jgi:pyridoxal phosphate enzyme (YggS family)
MPIADNIQNINKQINDATSRCGRLREEIRLVAVSKTHGASAIDEAAAAGQLIFGENYFQELSTKSLQVKNPVEWHFIGHLQSNKVRQIAGLVSMIHSVDRLSLAQEIDRQWEKIGKVCDILVQVNVSGETSKSGATSAETTELVKQISKLPHLKLRGLMTMPPFFDEPECARPYFRELKELADTISREEIPGVSMKELSMGMSGDFEVAIEEGATLLRIGTAIFGER